MVILRVILVHLFSLRELERPVKKEWRAGSQVSARMARLTDTERSVQLHALHKLVDLLVFSPLLCRQEHRLGLENIEFTCAQESVEWVLGDG